MIAKILGIVVFAILLTASEFCGYRIIRSGLEWQEVGDMLIGLLMMLIPLLIIVWILGI